ncbi:MAG: hypothetical protein GY716_06115 [bacterium]|nr:hypothetical protein [bacterium]
MGSAVAGTVLVAAGMSPAVFSGSDGLIVQSVTVQGDVVHVVVSNPGTETVTATVSIQVRTASKETGSMLPVTVFGGQKVFVQFAMGAQVREIIAAGVIIDDGSPF